MPITRRTALAQRINAPAPLLWRDQMPPDIVAAHDRTDTIASADLIDPGGVLYGGRGLFLRDGTIHHEPGIAPDYIQMMIDQMGIDYKPVQKWLRGLLSADLTVTAVDTPAIVPVHPHWNFGHFLMEILPRLLLLDRETPRDWPILIARDEPGFIETMVRLACPERPVVTFDPMTEAIRAPRLTGCSDLITPRGAAPGLRGLFDDLRDRLLALASGGAPVAERIFLSRAGVQKRRHVVVDSDAIEQAVAAAGYLVVRPEELSFPDQVRLFASARVITGEYGSALHNAVFARPGTTVVCLNWINPYQSQIAALMDHRIGYVPPQDGRFRTADALWTGDKTMRFDADDVMSRLATLG